MQLLFFGQLTSPFFVIYTNTLPENSNIFASEYSLYLPDKKMLQKKLQEWIDEETGGEDD